MTPGTRAGALAEAAAVIEQAGFTAIDDLVHGFGGGNLPPVVPAPGRPMLTPHLMLPPRMTLVAQPNVATRDGRAGVQAGELLVVIEQGPRVCTSSPHASTRPAEPHEWLPSAPGRKWCSAARALRR